MPETQIEADALYRIRMKKSVYHDFQWFRPGDAKIVVIGSVLSEIKDAVLDYEKVQ